MRSNRIRPISLCIKTGKKRITAGDKGYIRYQEQVLMVGETLQIVIRQECGKKIFFPVRTGIAKEPFELSLKTMR
ncbi:MAG: hypothetical protein JXA44_13405 [Methanospirillaceae archaeon]|nr:hypothetical protein [Methanospirillaceae archaeon]